MQRLLTLTTLVLSFLIVGCGGAKSGHVSGSVTLNGQPVQAGQVTAYAEANQAVGIATIQAGEYSLTDLPLGPVVLVVQTHGPDGRPLGQPALREGEKPPPVQPKEGAGSSTATPEVAPVPLKYTQQKSSGLNVTVVPGSTRFDIPMSGKGEIPRLPMPRR